MVRKPQGADRAVSVLLAVRGLGPASHRRLLRAATREKTAPADLLAWDPHTLRRAANLSAVACRTLQEIDEPGRQAAACVADLDANGIQCLVEGDCHYPRRLKVMGEDAPVVLFVRGDPAMLNAETGAAVGSRQPSNSASGFVSDLCGRMAEDGTVIVSGGARGIDAAAHGAALEHGRTVMVLPVGLEKQWKTPALRQLSERDRGSVCILSQFPPQAGWDSGQAIMRNRVICALADWVLAADPRDRGGTWSSCRFALELGRPLMVVTDASTAGRQRAVRKLVRQGAVSLPPHTVPAPDALRKIAESMKPVERPVQSKLFGE